MATWVDPFTGEVIDAETGQAPLGGPYPALPPGQISFADVPWLDASIDQNTNLVGLRGYEVDPDRGRMFYLPGDEWRIIQSQSDLSSLQAALDAVVGIEGSYIDGAPDKKTADAMRKVLEAANARGVGWQEILGGGFDAESSRGGGGRGGGGGGGGGGGVAAISDDDIRALANEMAKDVLGRILRPEESEAFVPSFRGALAGGTSPQVVAEDLIRRETAPAEAGAHSVGNVMNVIAQALGG